MEICRFYSEKEHVCDADLGEASNFKMIKRSHAEASLTGQSDGWRTHTAPDFVIRLSLSPYRQIAREREKTENERTSR